MEVYFADTLIADGTRMPPNLGWDWVGKQDIVPDGDEDNDVPFPIGRGNRQRTWPISVSHLFDTLREAEEFFLTHYDSLPDSGTLQIICGVSGDESTWVCPAVLESCNPSLDQGAKMVTMEYVFLIGHFVAASS